MAFEMTAADYAEYIKKAYALIHAVSYTHLRAHET